MAINIRNKGNAWERELSKLLNEKTQGTWKRIPGSGALGTQLQMGSLTSDINGSLPFTKKTFKIEAKVGYGSAKQFTMKKEWLDKVKMEADQTYSIPLLGGKFSGAREGIRYFIVLDLDTFCDLMNLTTDLYTDLVDTIDKTPKV
jgi:hypothetical protein